MALRPVHRLDEPARLSLSMVASPQCRFRFARQDHCSSATTFGLNFRMRRDSTGAPNCAPEGRQTMVVVVEKAISH